MMSDMSSINSNRDPRGPGKEDDRYTGRMRCEGARKVEGNLYQQGFACGA